MSSFLGLGVDCQIVGAQFGFYELCDVLGGIRIAFDRRRARVGLAELAQGASRFSAPASMMMVQSGGGFASTGSSAAIKPLP